MQTDPNIMQAVEQLGYRVTVGDIATKAGLNINLAEKGLLTLASEAGGHLQVAETGDVVYQFPQNFRDILRNKYIQLQIQEWWQKVWRVLFYLIRISFGLILILSILLIFLTIFAILTAANSSSDDRNDSGSSSGGGIFYPRFWFGPDWFWFFYWDYDNRPYRRYSPEEKRELNFLEAVFSFIFGDGNPNANIDERRWQIIGSIIRNNKGAVIAEQIAPYLDEIAKGYATEYEEYMLPVLTRFNGRPEVSNEGQLIYHFPELQTTAHEHQQETPLPAYLREWLWRFSKATSGQILLAAGLGVVNLAGALFLGYLLLDPQVIEGITGLAAFVASIYGVLLAYGVGFLAIPSARYFWIKFQNKKIDQRNQLRQERAAILAQPDEQLQHKLSFAKQFAGQKIITTENLAYTTETDLEEQEFKKIEKGEDDWIRRLKGNDNL